MRPLLTVMVLTSLAAPAFAQRRGGPRADDGPPRDARPAWEYKELSRPEVEALATGEDKGRFAAGLNKLGSDGWELVALDPAGGRPARYLFKRAAGKAVTGKAPAQAQTEGEFRIVRLSYARAAEMAKTLTAVFQGAESFRVIPEERTNAVLLSGSEAELHKAERIITELDREVAEKPGAKPK
jgi:hypothetical protein